MAETEIKAAAMLGMEAVGNALRVRFRDQQINVYALDLGEPTSAAKAVAPSQNAVAIRKPSTRTMTVAAIRRT
jgi:hypothetical protein